MKNLLIATTALVATAGMASAEVAFTGKGEAGMYQTSKTEAVKQKLGTLTTVGGSGTAASAAWDNTKGKVVITAATTTVTAATAANATAARNLVTTVELNLAAEIAETARLQALVDVINVGTAMGTARSNLVAQQTVETNARKSLAIAKAVLASNETTAASVAKAGDDMAAYSGYDMNVALSAETDSGIVFGMGFDMGAGLIADQNDDRAMDSQGAVIGTSALTATMSGYTLSIGSDKLDDVYDDTQNGDIGLSGNVGGIAFNLVHDLTDEVAATKTKEGVTNVGVARKTGVVYYKADGTQVTEAATTNIAATDSDARGTTWTAGTAATVETTSLSLGGATGAVSYTFAMTTGNDAGDSAAKGSVTYTGMENLALTLAHDNAGKLEGISKVTAKYTMGSLTATLSMADDKDHKGNKNKNTKASSNLSLAYAANGLSATFATDESSQWWVNTQYDLGGGAQAFATIDHTEFAVVGLNFNF